MTDYLNKYAKKTPMFQAGGPVEGGAPAGAPAEAAPQGGGGIEEMAAQYAQTRDPQLAVQIADAVVEMIAQSQGGAPQGGPAPAMKNGGRLDSNTPMFSNGGVVIV
jgi:hypothetical protein